MPQYRIKRHLIVRRSGDFLITADNEEQAERFLEDLSTQRAVRDYELDEDTEYIREDFDFVEEDDSNYYPRISTVDLINNVDPYFTTDISPTSGTAYYLIDKEIIFQKDGEFYLIKKSSTGKEFVSCSIPVSKALIKKDIAESYDIKKISKKKAISLLVAERLKENQL